MILSAHAALGAAIGAATNCPAVAVPVALVSHLLLDSFPHADIAHLVKPLESGELSDEQPRWVPIVIGADLTISAIIILVGAILYPDRVWSIVLGGLVAILPDFQYAPGFGPWLCRQFWYKPYEWLHERGHIHFPLTYAQRYWGYHPQILALIGSILWLLRAA